LFASFRFWPTAKMKGYQGGVVGKGAAWQQQQQPMVKGGMKGGYGKSQTLYASTAAFSPYGMKGGKAGMIGMKGYGKGKMKGPMVAFEEMPLEKQAEIRARHQEKALEEGRVEEGEEYHQGEISSRGKTYGWVKPTYPTLLPESVQLKMAEMTATKKEKAIANMHNDNFAEEVLYLRMSDVAEGVTVGKGMAVQFRVYYDNEGAGAFDVHAAE